MRALILFLSLLLSGSPAISQKPDYIFVFLNKKTDKAELPEEEVKKIMDGHMANMNRLANEGKLIAAGPFDGGGGIFIFVSNSVEQVQEWVQTDPGVQAKRWNVEILPFYLQYGSVCRANEPYSMVSYQFIRYLPNVAKYTISEQPDFFKKHHDYLKGLRASNSILVQANFGDQEGGILVVNGELTLESIRKDPAVFAAMLDADVKKLWIAKGSFCEK